MRNTPLFMLASAIAMVATPAVAGPRTRPIPPMTGVPHGPAMGGMHHTGMSGAGTPGGMHGGGHWGQMHQGRWVGGWNAPGGWNAYRRPVRGWRLPSYWISPSFAIVNYGLYGLASPSAGYGWSRYYDDAVLVDGSGRVIDSRSGIAWDSAYGDDGSSAEYGPSADYDAEAYRWDDRVTAGNADYDQAPHGRDENYDYDAGAPYPPPYNAQPPLRRPPPPVIMHRAPPPVRYTEGGYDHRYAYGAQSYGYAGGGDVIVEIIPGGATTTTTTTTYYETVSAAAKKRVWRAKRHVRAVPKCGCR